MSDTTLEQARRCPRCDEPGALAGKRPAPERYMGTLHLFKCANNRCVKFDEIVRVVQVRPDGTIPDPVTDREKSFPQEKGVARSRIEKARANADASLNQSLG